VKKENLSRLNAKSDVDVHIPKSELQNSGCLVLIIANERYAMGRVSNVQFAKNDGNGIKQYCINTLGVPEQNIMICQDATLSQIKAGVSWLQQKSNVGGYDKAIVYYAGHGIPDYTTSKSYILPSDGNPMDLATAYSLNEFYESLSFVKVKQCVAFIDACFSGTDRRGAAINEVRGISIKPTEPEPKGNDVVFSACSGDETAQPYPAKHHGVFTYFLLKYLQEKSGNVKCSDLYNYIRSNVSNSTLDISGKKQSPSVHVASRASNDWMNWSLK
jgi:hypothetical protein